MANSTTNDSPCHLDPDAENPIIEITFYDEVTLSTLADFTTTATNTCSINVPLKVERGQPESNRTTQNGCVTSHEITGTITSPPMKSISPIKIEPVYECPLLKEGQVMQTPDCSMGDINNNMCHNKALGNSRSENPNSFWIPYVPAMPVSDTTQFLYHDVRKQSPQINTYRPSVTNTYVSATENPSSSPHSSFGRQPSNTISQAKPHSLSAIALTSTHHPYSTAQDYFQRTTTHQMPYGGYAYPYGPSHNYSTMQQKRTSPPAYRPSYGGDEHLASTGFNIYQSQDRSQYPSEMQPKCHQQNSMQQTPCNISQFTTSSVLDNRHKIDWKRYSFDATSSKMPHSRCHRAMKWQPYLYSRRASADK